MSKPHPALSTLQWAVLVCLRVALGWHFLYEGVAKLYTPGWTSQGFLDVSRWVLADLFRWIAATPAALRVVDWLNVWGQVLIGLGLIAGCMTRAASIAGALMLGLYYVANPPFIGMDFAVPAEGSTLIVNKNLVEMIALIVVAVLPTSRIAGLDRILAGWWQQRKAGKVRSRAPVPGPQPLAETPPSLGRRGLLAGVATLPVLPALAYAVARKKAWESDEDKHLVDACTSATIKAFNFSSLQDLKGQVPRSRIGQVEFSRLILGGNLIGGWAHARDLIYVSELVKSYHHRDKVFETFLLAEKCGINAVLTNPILCRVINDYWRRDIGKIRFISDCGGTHLLERVQMSIDHGASACYVQGETADRLVREGQFDLIGKALDLIRQNRMPAGIGGHYLQTVKACDAQGLKPDFWMKTFHHHGYWSARPGEKEQDNIYCREPQDTMEFMQGQTQPWIAFKVLAAGAIDPKDGFRYAFENGADFICVGMYDFQIVDDVNITLEVLQRDLQRKRPWRV
ncbi:MAG: DoxX family protein [Phycisphaerae bacterium]|nr:DoxX family protein [Phycisphaerae bacterium]